MRLARISSRASKSKDFPAPVSPVEKEAPEQKAAFADDPDITSPDEVAFPSRETAPSEDAKAIKRQQKRTAREEKLAQKEAKRKEKLDKKKKVRRTDFTPGSDIDIFPEDTE